MGSNSVPEYPGWVYDESGQPNPDLAKMYTAARDALVQRIDTAFADVPYPGDDNLTIPDDPYYGFFGNVAGIRKDFRGLHWKEIPLQLNVWSRSSLSILSPPAYRFYLPAWMRASILHIYESDEIHLEAIRSLIGHGFYSWFFNERMTGFTSPQKSVILEFLRFCYFRFDELDMSFYGDMLEKAVQYWETHQDEN